MKISCSMLVIVLLVASTAQAQFGGGFGAATDDEATSQDTTTPVVQRWKIGFSILAKNGPCAGVFATIPIPIDWPEQSVRVIKDLTDVSPQVKRIKYRMLGGGVKQMLVTIPALRAGDEAHVYMTFEVTKRIVRAPEDVASLTIPPSVPSVLRPFVGNSPYIETTDDKIKELAAELVKGQDGAWEKVEAIYDWVRENVEYKNGELKGALAALNDGDGDCEELTSLFVALCRANGIPARSVWIEGHCYPEFYLVDANRKGHWFPCQAAGTRDFGGMFDKRLILQKGDKFKVPEKKGLQRYVEVHLSAKSVRGSGGPVVTFVRELALDDQPIARIR